jgi:hypothetical protein
LSGLAAWSELGEPRLDVQDGRAVDGVEVFDEEVEALDLDESTAGDA